MKSVWVDFIRFNSVEEAAKYVSKQIKGEVKAWQIQAALDHSYPIGGMWIRDSRPAGVTRSPLLRFPPNETPLCRGLPGVWR